MAGNFTKLDNVINGYRLRYKGKSQNIKAKSDKEAGKALAAFVTDIDRGNITDISNHKFRELSDKWLKEYAEINLAASTVYKSKFALNKYILPALGDTQVDNITPLALTEYYNSLRRDGIRTHGKEGGLSEETIRTYHKIISGIFDVAIGWEIYKKRNPCKSVKFPKLKKKPAPFFDDKQLQAVFRALEQEDIEHRTGVTLAIDSGVRLGELSGLKWEDINWDKKTVKIDKASQYISGKGTFEKDPKTENSYRSIVLPNSTIALLDEYKKSQQAKGFLCADNNNIFVGYNGKPKYTYWLTSWFPQFLKRHNLPHLKFHGTRHSHASYLLNSGMNINAVAERIGDTPTVLMNIYGHAIKKADKEAADMLDELHETRNLLDK